MSAFEERRAQDIQKLTDLAERSLGRVKLTRVAGRPPNDLDIELHFKTAPSKQYPRVVQEVTKLNISLPARYPLVEPIVSVRTPIFHPHVYTSGRICLGLKWLPTFGLDLLVTRIAQIITFDPAVLDESSPANRDAQVWYRQAQRTHTGAFPTDSWAISPTEPQKKMTWSNVSSGPAQKTIVPCPGCSAKLSLPSGRKGQVKCPKCNKAFEAAT